MSKTLVYTRPQMCPIEIVNALARNKIDVVHLPMIQTISLPWTLTTPLSSFDWLFFTSVNGVNRFDFSKIISEIKIAAIGEKTAEILEHFGQKIDFMPQKFDSEDMAEEWLATQASPKKILLPTSLKTRQVLKQELENAGHFIKEIYLYDTIFPDSSYRPTVELIKKQKIDFLVFSSPSAWTHYFSILQSCQMVPTAEQPIIFSIGPVTTRKIVETGFRVDYQAKKYTMEDVHKMLLKELVDDARI